LLFSRQSSTSPRRPLTRLVSHLVIAALVAVVVPFTVAPSPVSAASCTGWDSRQEAPDTIRVYRTGKHRVDVVDFRQYVGIVMASGEWPTYLPRALVEAGAVAVKQYAWYYTLQGHHRPWYETASGVCYDVVDNTNDQLFEPETADVSEKQLKAVAETWGLTLRKNDRFFLTGYRAGADVGCGDDADGWKLYAKSAWRCANQGMDRQQIQELYYRPNVRFVWTTPPPADGDVQPPRLTTGVDTRLRDSVSLGDRVLRVDWSAAQDDSGIARYQVQRSTDGGSWTDLAMTRRSVTHLQAGIGAGHDHRFRVRAQDGAGNWSEFTAGPEVASRRLQSPKAVFTGAWNRSGDRTASRGDSHYSTQAGARASLTFTGRSIAVVAPVGSDRGQARISVDGQAITTIDLRASNLRPRRIVYQQDWVKSAQHTIQLEVLATAGRPRVDLDAFLILR